MPTTVYRDPNHPKLVEKQNCLTRAKHLMDSAKRDGNRDMTVEEAAECDRLIAEADRLEGEWLKEPQKRQTRPPALGGYSAPTDYSTTGLFGGDGASVADRLFGRKHETGGFASFGEWLQSVDSGRFDQRLQAANRIGVDSEGGFLVPQVYQNMFLDAVVEQTILVKRVRKFPMTSDTLNLSGFSGNDHTSTLFGGLMGAWEGELTTATPQTPTARRVSFQAKKLLILTQASNELVADADSYEQILGEALTQTTAWKLDYSMFRGTGAGQPLGIIGANSTISVAAEGGQTAGTIWFLNCVKMFARLHPACYNTSIWCINPTCIPALMTMDMHADTAGSGSLVGDSRYEPFKEANGKFTLFGRPVEVTEKLPTVGTVGDIVLVDPTQYGLAMRQEVVVEKSVHAGFTTDSSYYRAKLRADGMPLWADPMTPNAGDTLSWCVTLAARS